MIFLFLTPPLPSISVNCLTVFHEFRQCKRTNDEKKKGGGGERLGRSVQRVFYMSGLKTRSMRSSTRRWVGEGGGQGEILTCVLQTTLCSAIDLLAAFKKLNLDALHGTHTHTHCDRHIKAITIKSINSLTPPSLRLEHHQRHVTVFQSQNWSKLLLITCVILHTWDLKSFISIPNLISTLSSKS